MKAAVFGGSGMSVVVIEIASIVPSVLIVITGAAGS